MLCEMMSVIVTHNHHRIIAISDPVYYYIVGMGLGGPRRTVFPFITFEKMFNY